VLEITSHSVMYVEVKRLRDINVLFARRALSFFTSLDESYNRVTELIPSNWVAMTVGACVIMLELYFCRRWIRQLWVTINGPDNKSTFFTKSTAGCRSQMVWDVAWINVSNTGSSHITFSVKRLENKHSVEIAKDYNISTL